MKHVAYGLISKSAENYLAYWDCLIRSQLKSKSFAAGFTGRFPIVGGIGIGGGGGGGGCQGVVDASAGCPLPMLGM